MNDKALIKRLYECRGMVFRLKEIKTEIKEAGTPGSRGFEPKLFESDPYEDKALKAVETRGKLREEYNEILNIVEDFRNEVKPIIDSYIAEHSEVKPILNRFFFKAEDPYTIQESLGFSEREYQKMFMSFIHNIWDLE